MDFPSQPSHRLEGRQKWHDLFNAWEVDPSSADWAFDDVCRAYAGPDRFYHTLDHVLDVVKTVEQLGRHCRNLNATKLAAWLHDVIYDSRASDNEERSAGYTERLCETLSISTGGLAASLILKTKSHDAGDDPDAWVLLDADLAILGASQTRYRIYSESIRLEYGWVPEPEYRAGRRRVLENFLARPNIFLLLRDLEEPARRNLAAEIAELSS